jgi:hypothetical protein
MKAAARYSLIALAVLAMLAALTFVLAVKAGLSSMAREDSIVLGSKLVQEAINNYVEKHGSPPRKLEELVPEYIGSVPSFPEISKVDYSLSADGKGWTLDLYRTNRKVPLIYRRTNTGLNVEDAQRRIDTENGCYVLKAR